MPEEGAEFLANEHLLSFEQIERFVKAVLPLGVTKIRLTGGEPLLRPKLHQLVECLAGLPGVDDLALTTNGMLLERYLPDLVQAGLRRLNISLDTLSESTFKTMSRRSGLQKVLEGIEAALTFPQLSLKLNALVLRNVNESDVLELIDFAVARGLHLRFIEFMPLDAERAWTEQLMVSGQQLRTKIAEQFGPLEPLAQDDPARPSRDFRLAGGGKLGFIDSVSQPFCSACDRLRLTADGKMRNCLFGTEEWDVGPFLNSDYSGDALREQLRRCVLAKHAQHGIDDPNFRPPQRAMYQIGG
jgi:cyclic pyranopterin phosphate synthase